MSTELLDIERQAMTLSAKDRAQLAKHLIASLDDLAGQEIESMWVAEADRRYHAHIDGEVQSRPMTDAIKDARAKLK